MKNKFVKTMSYGAFLTGILTSQMGHTALHSDTTPYEALQSKLQLEPGQTYLSFMKNQVKPALDAFEDAINEESQKHPNQYSRWQTDLINEGAGVAIRIDAHNYFFNVGYLTGSDKNDIKSGRSYGVGPTHRESDPSDAFYLSELQKYLTSEPEQAAAFTKAIMLVITNCDASGWADLSTAGQIVATDFLAIYTAELDRHLMVQLRPSAHPWEIDLAAATFVSVFNTTTGLMPDENGKLANGQITNWWAKGQQGSGIGETRTLRRKLTAEIGAFEGSEHPETVKAIEAVIGSSNNGDMIQNLFAYLNSPSGPESLRSNQAEALSEAFGKYVTQMKDDANAIVSSVGKTR